MFLNCYDGAVQNGCYRPLGYLQQQVKLHETNSTIHNGSISDKTMEHKVVIVSWSGCTLKWQLYGWDAISIHSSVEYCSVTWDCAAMLELIDLSARFHSMKYRPTWKNRHVCKQTHFAGARLFECRISTPHFRQESIFVEPRPDRLCPVNLQRCFFIALHHHTGGILFSCGIHSPGNPVLGDCCCILLGIIHLKKTFYRSLHEYWNVDLVFRTSQSTFFPRPSAFLSNL